MAIAALVLWMCTAAIGSYLLATGIRSNQTAPEARERVPTPPRPAATATPAAAQVRVQPVRDRDRFDPPSLRRAKSEPLPGLRAFAEFAHPALAIVGLGIWLGYVLSRDRVFAAIGFGVLLGAICAGVSWVVSSNRAAKRAAAIQPDGSGDPGAQSAGHTVLSFSPRLLLLHAIGAALTVLIAALITARA